MTGLQRNRTVMTGWSLEVQLQVFDLQFLVGRKVPDHCFAWGFRLEKFLMCKLATQWLHGVKKQHQQKAC